MNYNTDEKTITIIGEISDSDLNTLQEVLNKKRHGLKVSVVLKTQVTIPYKVVYAFLMYQKQYENIELFLCECNYVYMRELGLVDKLNIKLLKQC